MPLRKVLFLAILILGFVLHWNAISSNHFYFTVDQGRDAVYVRETLNYKEIFLKGPETTIRGIFTGPLWYYFIAIGYALFNGNPIGGVVMVILLNLFATAVLMMWIGKKLNWIAALITGLLLQIFWPFFVTSLWAFNPFPLTALFIFEILILSEFLGGRKKFIYLGLLPIFLAFNTNLAGFVVMALVYLLTIVWRFRSRFRAFAFFDGRIFGGLNFGVITPVFIAMVGSTVMPSNTTVGALIFAVIFLLFLKRKKVNQDVKNFVFLSILTFVVSFLFFGSNRGWRDWHTNYLPPLLFVSLLLMFFSLGKRLALVLLVLVATLQINNFYKSYKNYIGENKDKGILANQLKVMDWIYSHNEENGFHAYVYTDTFYDYNYQYLFSWYGRSKYGFYPCEYANFPVSHKILYVPGWEHYVEPKLGCDKLRFLIIESDTNGEENKDWMIEWRSKHVFLERTEINETVIEKYKTPDIY